MPQGENFWNPYRWVTVSEGPVLRAVPNYHHTLSGLSGRLWCELEALTPLIIGDGQAPNIQFVRHQHNSQPYIPGTSLKGPIRSLAEVVGNAAIPFPKVAVDSAHALSQARSGTEPNYQFDILARTFGYLDDSNVVAGLIHFSDAEITKEVAPPYNWQQFTVDVGQPQPSHGAFYPKNSRGENNRRKFYHHHPNAKQLSEPQANQTPPRTVRPAPPGTCFSFTVDFTNLRNAELNLLLYCLALEEQVSVTLSTDALGPNSQKPVTLKGPLRHKIGGAKPHGAGSVQIRITKMDLCADAKARYQGGSSTNTLQGPSLLGELNKRTALFQVRGDQTMKELRAMLIYSTDDPRCPIHYPDYDWFLEERDRPLHQKTPLKPTI